MQQSNIKYTVDYDDKYMQYCVVRWTLISPGIYSGESVYRDSVQENAVAMCEEFQYSAECTEWALFNNQESEFDYV